MSEWQPIKTAPKDGTEIIGWREDCGLILVRYTCMANFMTESEIEAEEKRIGHTYDEDTLWADDWFYADFVRGGRMDVDEAPTHWMLPEPPQRPDEEPRLRGDDAERR